MFDGLAEAMDALAGWFDPLRLERVVEALVPAIVFTPMAPGTRRVGGTHIGGVPDVPQGFAWPSPPVPADPWEIAGRANAETGKELLDHMKKGLPYAFIAQVDLGEAARLGPVADGLPREGRLLFFYDHATGPWDTGKRAARVIWETSPAVGLSPALIPDDLAEAARAELEALGELRPAGNGGTLYGAPLREMRLAVTWRMPDPAAFEADDLPELRSDAAGEDAEAFREDYEEALQEHHDSGTSELWRRQQLLGSPQPEQDDPRLDAVVVSQFGVQHLSRDEWRAKSLSIRTAAPDWRLLLQLDVGDWMQAPFVEGTVYFLIGRDDLARRRFDEVVAVYQQT